MKKTLSLVLALCLVLALAACGGAKTSSAAPAASSTAPAASSAAPASSEAPKLDYPKKNITITVPYAAGGSSDMTTRSVADYLSSKMGVNVVVQNTAGAGGAVGSAAVATAKGDGYSLLMGSIGPLTIAPYSSDTGYTYDKAFKAVSQLTDIPIGIAVNKSSNIKTMADFVDYCKANPGVMQVGNVGAGNIQHVAVSYFCNKLGLDVVHVPYEGANPAVAALLGNNIPSICVGVTELTSNYLSGDFIVLGIFANERLDTMPDVPTMKELGYGDDMVFGINYGIVAPISTDDAIIDYLDDQIAAAMQDETVLKTMESLFLIPSYADTAAYDARIRSDCEKNEQVLTDLGLHR